VTDVVVDASAALGWILRSQATASGAAFLERGDGYRLFAPSVFSWETRNVLLSLDRRGVIASIDYAPALRALDDLQISFAPPLEEDEVQELTTMARRVGLSLFDTAYFTMALDRSMALASRDGGLLRIAAASVIECFDLRVGASP
jgi:predicted nucleic acid-binding protein